MIVVTYIDQVYGSEHTVEFARRKEKTRSEIANRGMRRMYGKRWRARYKIENVTDTAEKEDYEAPEEIE